LRAHGPAGRHPQATSGGKSDKVAPPPVALTHVMETGRSRTFALPSPQPGVAMSRALWNRYRQFLCVSPSIRLWLDISRMKFAAGFFPEMEPALQRAYRQMDELEKGAIANPDEQRLVGHYWLRDAARAPTPELRRQIEDALSQVNQLARQVHNSQLRGEQGHFINLLVIGIGGSALGPQFVSAALGTTNDRMRVHFFDNTDPDG